MDLSLLIFLSALIMYIPLTGVLLYVWWKHGKGERGVQIARVVFLVGSAFLFMLLITR